MPSFGQFLAQLAASTQRLNGPAGQAEQQQQDLNPDNFRQIDDQMQRQPWARETLLDERKRLEQMQLMQLQKASQQFAPRLQQELSLQKHTGIPTRPRLQGAIPGVNGAPQYNPRPSGQVPPAIYGVRG